MHDQPPCPTPHKRKHITRDQAEHALERSWRLGRQCHLPIRSYYCTCGYWHTTSEPLGRYNARTLHT